MESQSYFPTTRKCDPGITGLWLLPTLHGSPWPSAARRPIADRPFLGQQQDGGSHLHLRAIPDVGLSGSCLYFSNTPRASEKQQQSMAPGPASGRGVRRRARQLRLLLPSVRNGSTPIGAVQVFLNFGLNNTLICLGTMWERSRMLAPGSSLLDFSFPKIEVKKGC